MHQKIIKILIAILFVAFQFLGLCLPCLASPKRLTGDVDGDGRVTLEDARRIALTGPRIIESLPDPKIADINTDGAITDGDALALAEQLTGQKQLVAAFVEHGKGKQFIIGSMVTICVFFKEKDELKAGGTVRVTSKKGEYDSGIQKLTLSGDGRYLFYQWSTTGLKSTDEYEVRASVNHAEETKVKAVSGPSQLSMRLIPRLAEKKVFVTHWDLSLPSPTGKMQFERRFTYESSFYPYSGPLGYVWNHNFNLRLREYPDGMIALFQADRPVAYFKSKPDGSYESSPGDYRVLRRSDDQSFELTEKDQTTWHFRTDFLLDRISDPNGNTLLLSYDQNRLLTSISDNVGQKFLFKYDPSGHIVHVADHLGRKVGFKYDKVGNLVEYTDIAGHTGKYEYDSEHRLTRVVYPDGSSQSYSYNKNGQLASEEWDQGLDARYYNYGYETGEVTISDATGRGTRIRVNELGQPVKISDCLECPGGNWSMAYDENFNLSQLKNPADLTYRFSFDDRGNRIASTNPLGNHITYSYNPKFNKIATLIDAKGNKTIFNYDEKGNLVETIYPDGSKEIFKYDVSGNMVSKTDRAAQTIKYSYDRRGLLLKKKYPDGTEASYTYDKQGNMTKTMNSASSIEFEYDQMGRVSKVTYPGGRSFDYEYNVTGKRTRMTNPDGKVQNYKYDIAGRLTRIMNDAGRMVVEYPYDAAGRRVKKRLGNGCYTIYEYNDVGQILRINNYNPKDSLVSYFYYTYDATRNRLSKETVEGTEKYTYDALNQLTSVIYPDGSRTEFLYDPMGNRLTTVENGVVMNYSVNNLNQCIIVGSTICEYDGNGNLISRTEEGHTTFYYYDFENQLIRVETPTNTIECTYNPLGLRNSRSDSLGQVFYLWDGDRLAIEESDKRETVAKYVWGQELDEAIRMDRNGREFYYLQDALLSVSELMNHGGDPIETYSYYVFGQAKVESKVGNPWLFTGAYYDPNTGLQYSRYRYYSPSLGIFISADPINLLGGLNLYSYSLNNPATLRDPYGLFVWFVPLVGGGTGWAAWHGTIGGLGVPGSGSIGSQIGGHIGAFAGGAIGIMVGGTQGSTAGGILGGYIGGHVGGWLGGGVCPTFVQRPTKFKSTSLDRAKLDTSQERLVSIIRVPADFCLLRSDIPIFGLAAGMAFSSYRVEYGEGGNPTDWYPLEESTVRQDSVPDFQDISWMQGDLDIRGNLATWNTGLKNWVHLPWHPPEDTTDLNGVYTLRLVVSGKNGETVEDRVTVEVGRVIAQCLPGIAVSTDEKVTMRFEEQSLMAPFRIYTIKPVETDLPSIPENQSLVSSVYQIREGGDRFIKPVTLEMEYPPDYLGKGRSSSSGVFVYSCESKEWHLLETEFDETQNVLSTQLYSLPEPKAYFAIMTSRQGAHQSIPVDSDAIASMNNLKREKTEVSESVLVNDTFEESMGEWSDRDREAGAQVTRDNIAPGDGSYCLKIENKNFSGNFACDVYTSPFDAQQFPIVSFDYKVTADVEMDFLAKVEGRWYDIGFTDGRNDYKNKDVNIEYLGQIPGIITDGNWHSTSFNIYEMLQRTTRNTSVEQLIMADWDVGGYMKLEFGRNRRGASFYIDNFTISKELDLVELLPQSGGELWIEDFNSNDSLNLLAGKRGLFSCPGITTCKSEIQHKGTLYDSREHVLSIDFDVSAAKNYGGFWTSLNNVSINPSSELVFEVKGDPDVPPLLVGMKRLNGFEVKVPLRPYLVNNRTGTEFLEGHIPLEVFGGLGVLNSMDNLSFSFENELGSGKGEIIIDNIRFLNSRSALKKLTVDDFEGPGGKYNFLGGEEWVFSSGEAMISSEMILDSLDEDNYCLRISYGGSIGKDLGLEGFSYCGWATSLEGLDIRQFDFLEFDIRGAQGGEKPNVYLDDGNMRLPFLFKDRVDCTTQWQHVEIPISAFEEQGIDISHLAEIQFVFEWERMNGTVYIDNLQFKSSPSFDTQHAALPGDKK